MPGLAAVGADHPERGAAPVVLEVGAADDEHDPFFVRRDPRVGDALHGEHVVDRERVGRGPGLVGEQHGGGGEQRRNLGRHG
jgi:hypothetical protein